MNCVIEGSCIKVFGKAVHALSRIGDELWLDPMVKGLALRSVSSALSAYGGFLFSPLFFQQYSLRSLSEQHRQAIKCKVLMKSVLSLFRCLTSIERSVQECHISITTPTDRVMIQFICRHGITKTHNLSFQESEAVEAMFATHLCPNVLKAPARLLGDMVAHFPVFQEEITLSTTPLKVCLRNYQEGGKGHMKMTCTEMSLHPDEFDHFQIGEDSDITFCLKELRGILSFAASHCLPVSVHFGAAGNPVCFSVKDEVVDATVVLATLNNSESRGPPQPETPAPATPRCADAAVLPVGVCEEHERVLSSQGSPEWIHPLPRISGPTRLCEAEECASTTATPASTKICSLLFKALSSEEEDDEDDGCTARLPVLARYSDEDENDEDYPARSSTVRVEF
ncbi:cell cycle checkpoint control protein RAD9B [Austrofundulus limnaeus]|uniref:Cell cycle checkpoint control protein RAD9A n=1 Tax=Austrofundulus limnaeus TaxID=52670 RepID=A0A2I4D8N6_AUSLI|nr:PREDICTED: cell cycle checkpoint control protein RAD9B-like [Austrofundulus limnaeus]